MKRSITLATAVALTLAALATQASAASYSIEFYIAQMYQRAAADAAQDLSHVADELDENLENKKKLREAQRRLDAVARTANPWSWYYVETPDGKRWTRGDQIDAIQKAFDDALADLDSEQQTLQYELQRLSATYQAAARDASQAQRKSDNYTKAIISKF